MRIHRHITLLAATITAIGVATPVAGASDPPHLAGSAGSRTAVHHTDPTGARFVPERVWQEINDAIAVKLQHRL